MTDILIGSSLRSRPLKPCGDSHPTMVIASVGTSGRADDLEIELKKCSVAVSAGADAVTDHSFYGDVAGFHRRLVDELDALVSTVACYEVAALFQRREWAGASGSMALDILEEQVERGIDMITIHASFTQADLAGLGPSQRLIPTTSKGGGIMASYMRATGRENPYFEHFDDVLSICKRRNATISLGTTFRTATVCDGWDRPMSGEISAMGELVRRALSRGVPVMVEGLGHAPVSAIPTYVRITKAQCSNAPYRALPMATDIALGFDHISGAIGASHAVAGGANVITAMSRAEHIGLPSLDDVHEAVVAARIAAHCGDLAKFGDYSDERQMSRTRWSQGCKGDWTSAIYPSGARAALAHHGRLDDQLIQCGMCGDYCGIAAGIAAVRLSGKHAPPQA